MANRPWLYPVSVVVGALVAMGCGDNGTSSSKQGTTTPVGTSTPPGTVSPADTGEVDNGFESDDPNYNQNSSGGGVGSSGGTANAGAATSSSGGLERDERARVGATSSSSGAAATPTAWRRRLVGQPRDRRGEHRRARRDDALRALAIRRPRCDRHLRPDPSQAARAGAYRRFSRSRCTSRITTPTWK